MCVFVSDLLYLIQVLHPTLSAPKRTQMMKTAAKLLALKSNGLGESFKYKDVSAVWAFVCLCLLHDSSRGPCFNTPFGGVEAKGSLRFHAFGCHGRA